jgi:hypothetical protein
VLRVQNLASNKDKNLGKTSKKDNAQKGRVFTSHIYDKDLKYRLYQELLQCNNKRQIFAKWAKELTSL